MSEQTNEREVAIQLSGVKKMYKLGQIGGGTLTADLQSWWARIRGKEDPNTKIGASQRLVGKTFMALNGIDLTVYKGEALGIIGGNGAGKSTMLKLLSRVTAPTEGEIGINGRIASMLEVGTGFSPEMTGRENIYMNGAILGMTKAEIDAKMEDIIEFSEVRDFIDTPVKRYSSGMYVKLAFSVAAHLDSEIMIMDEVLAVGDMAFQKKCLDKMRDAAKAEGRTVLYVSHNMNTIRQLCDRCVVLDKGKIIFVGDVESAIQVYMDTSAANFGVDIELNDQHRKPYSIDRKTKMTHLQLLGKQTPSYEMNEPIPFALTVHAKEAMDAVSLRMEIRNADDTPVGTTIIPNFASLNAGDSVYRFEFNPTRLVPGRYVALLVLYKATYSGASVDLDIVNPACAFNIYDNTNQLQIHWNYRYWGHIQFPSLSVRSE